MTTPVSYARRHRRFPDLSARSGVLSIDLIESKSIPEPNCGCWIWHAGMTAKGYGEFRVGGIKWRAHRASWVVHHGPIPSGLFVCHRCDNRACVNPGHLFLGTPKENAADATQKNRLGKKLDLISVRAILSSPLSQKKAAQIFGVSAWAIGRIRAGKTWSHVKSEDRA